MNIDKLGKENVTVEETVSHLVKQGGLTCMCIRLHSVVQVIKYRIYRLN